MPYAMDNNSYNTVILVCCGVLLLVHIRVCLPEGPSFCKRSLLRSLWEWSNGFRIHCPWHGRKIEDNPFETCVARKVSLLLEENATAIYKMLLYGSGCALLSLANDALADRMDGRASWWLPRVVVLLSSCGCAAFMNMSPTYCKGRWRRFWYIMGHALICGYTYCTEPGAQVSRRFVFLIRLLLGFCHPHMGFGAACNAVYAAVSFYRSLVPNPAFPTELRGTGRLDVLQPLFLEGCEALIIVLFMQRTSRSFWSRARHEVQEKAWKGEGGAMLSLLNLVCDVVVELDGDLRIVEHVPRFAAMLAMPTFKDTKGMQLQDFMPAVEDHEKFRKELQERYNEHSGAGALHVRLRDSMGSLINAEIFYVEFIALDDAMHFFAGIREFAEYSVAELKTFDRSKKPRQGTHRDAGEVGKGTSPILVSQPVGPGPVEPPQAPAIAAPDRTASETLSSLSGSRSSKSSGSSAHGVFVPTKDMGKDVSLVATFARWYLPAAEEHCCPFHSAVKELHRCVERLETYGCARDFAPCGHQQCDHCGVLTEGRSRDTCDVCRRRMRMTRSRSLVTGRSSL